MRMTTVLLSWNSLVDNQFTVHYLQNALPPAHMRHPSLHEQILMVLDIRIFTKVHKNKNWFISINTEIYFEQELYSWRKLKFYNTNICFVWFPAFGGNDGHVLKRISSIYQYENISFWYPVYFWKCCFSKQCAKTVFSGMW
jgi:hypothetical protein